MIDKHTRWFRWTAVLFLILAGVIIALVMTGTFDPKSPVDELWNHDEIRLTIPASSQQILWLPQSIPEKNYHLRLTAANDSPELDIGYGLAIGDDAHHIAIIISPTGYVAIQENSNMFPLSGAQQNSLSRPEPSFMMPWQTWPHIRTGWEINEIWVESQNGAVTIRINREIVWAGQEPELEGQIGLFGESFGGNAVVEYQSVRLLTE